jgi:two-component system, NtrC family, sensor kinase
VSPALLAPDAASGLAEKRASFGAVLVVDDVEANLTAMDALLYELGCEIVLVRSGNEALRQLLKKDFAVMLLDVQMPEMDGYEVARYARENPTTRAVPILFLTAGGTPGGQRNGGTDGRGNLTADSVTEESVLRGYGSGAVDFLLKPVNPSILRSKVRVFLELHQGRRQIVDARNALENANRELRETALSKAALADRFQQANLELEGAYRDLQAAQTGLIQAAKMASLGELVAGIAHEINNPLAFCVSHLETAKRSLLAVDPLVSAQLAEPVSKQHWERAHTRLHEMTVGLTRINDLVLKLRAFSRLDEGERKQVDVKECVDSVLTILGHRLEPRIAVKTQFLAPDCIECNPGLFNQALMNLISNAIDAIVGEGTISISSQAEGGYFQLSVQDTGPGIDPKLRERVFEPFFTTKPVGQGTGLGLSIAYSIVQKHGGKLEVEDAPGGGTRMIMHVPLDDGRRAEDEFKHGA